MPGEGEPLWTDLDAAKAIAYLRFKREHCPSCGEDRTLWLDEHGKELPDPAKEIIAVLCPSCELLDDERAARAEKEHPMHGKHGIHLAFGPLLPPIEPESASDDE